MGENRHVFVYLEQGLHRTPEILREELQREIALQEDAALIILGYGLCSRAVIGLQARPYQKVISPKIDDCIGLSLGCRSRYYHEFNNNPGTYYFTRGWIEAGEDTLKEYARVAAKYGQETAEWTVRETLKHYKRVVLIRTNHEEDEPSRAYARRFAEFFGLTYEEMEGSLDYLKKLLFGPWDEDFVTVEGGMAISDEMFAGRHVFD